MKGGLNILHFFGKDQCFQKNGLWLINVILNSAEFGIVRLW